ncbi:MAG: ABC transporter ATP-binding protein [Clostridia bacterium]|nr:ABC transporter ATP-binding protein [Clostridia bacterium]
MQGPPPMPPGQYQYDKVPPPKSLSDLPRYLGQLLGGFFTRLFYIFSLVWQSGPIFLFLMSFVALFNGLMPLVGALLSKEILNELQAVITASALGQVFDKTAFWGSMVLLLLIWFFVYKILSKIVNRLSHAINRIAGERVVRHVRIRIMKKAQELDLASFDLPEFYEKLENANREAGNRPVNILNSTFEVISALISLCGYVIILAQALPIATLVIILLSIPSAVINFVYRRRTFSYMRRRSTDRRQMNYFSGLAVNKDLAKEIRMFDLGDEFIERYDTVFERYYKGLKGLIIRENVWQVILAILTAVVNCVFFAMIAFGVFRGEYQIGDYSLYTGALTSIAAGVTTLITTSATIYEGTLFIDNLLSFLREKPTIVPAITPAASPARGCAHTMELQNVGFTYPGTSRPVLQNINLCFRPGETVALVGLNGAGKTTLIKLITRLYDPTEGRILLDGRDLRDYDVQELYRLYGLIFQDFGKYAVSFSDNIRYGNLTKAANDTAIRTAAEKAGADQVAAGLPNGYDTQLMRYFDRDGIELSIGQWQKLSVARAFYSDADILILDEPTASLDALAEQEIFRRFDELRGDKTAIFVSHRLSSATIASKIVVLEHGRVVEEGTHRELMDKNGKYALLFHTQAERYLTEQQKGKKSDED